MGPLESTHDEARAEIPRSTQTGLFKVNIRYAS
jgi:hypothetical protein